MYGSDVRRSLEFEHGGSRSSNGVDWYVAGNVFAEDGWRDDSPSDVGQLFGKLGWRTQPRATSPSRSLTPTTHSTAMDSRSSVSWSATSRACTRSLTRPTIARCFSTSKGGARSTTGSSFSGNAYFRAHRTPRRSTVTSTRNHWTRRCISPAPPSRPRLLAAGYITAPVVGANASNTPFPYLRCVGNVLLNDEPAEKCNGLINRSESDQNNGGFSGQVTLRDSGRPSQPLHRRRRLTTAAAWASSSRPSSGISIPIAASPGTGAFGDGVTGGDADGEPFDTRVDLDGAIHTWSVFATDTLTLARALAPDAIRPLQPDNGRQHGPDHARRRARIAGLASTCSAGSTRRSA